MGKKSEHHEKRKYFRIEYPAPIKPTLKIRKHEFEVEDISEKGVRFSADKKIKFGRWVTGNVTFHDGQAIDIEGRIAWKRGESVGMFLTVKPIPYPKIISEQRFLARFKPEDGSSRE
ncbi:MAG: PilZ domain-containing protein [Deltaproteobacteria bacterium]|nr:PilZ domain-containing protein [Deltaproteobacteria bacterium]